MVKKQRGLIPIGQNTGKYEYYLGKLDPDIKFALMALDNKILREIRIQNQKVKYELMQEINSSLEKIVENYKIEISELNQKMDRYYSELEEFKKNWLIHAQKSKEPREDNFDKWIECILNNYPENERGVIEYKFKELAKVFYLHPEKTISKKEIVEILITLNLTSRTTQNHYIKMLEICGATDKVLKIGKTHWQLKAAQQLDTF